MLIVGASGGVGTFAVQIGKAFPAARVGCVRLQDVERLFAQWPLCFRKKRQVPRTRRPTGLDGAMLTGSGIAIKRRSPEYQDAEALYKRDERRVVAVA